MSLFFTVFFLGERPLCPLSRFWDLFAISIILCFNEFCDHGIFDLVVLGDHGLLAHLIKDSTASQGSHLVGQRGVNVFWIQTSNRWLKTNSKAIKGHSTWYIGFLAHSYTNEMFYDGLI